MGILNREKVTSSFTTTVVMLGLLHNEFKVPEDVTVKPVYSGHSVKQPPHYNSHLLQVTFNIMAYIWTLVKQPALYYSHKLMAHRRPP